MSNYKWVHVELMDMIRSDCYTCRETVGDERASQQSPHNPRNLEIS